MSKRNITYIKPDEPSFLKKLKLQAGYKEGPTVDTKREELGPAEDPSDGEEEQPTVVVLQEGDLTAEEVQREKQRLEIEAEEKRADLNERIVFNPRSKKEKSLENKNTAASKAQDSESKKNQKKLNNKTLLSFNDDEDEEEETDDN